MKTTLLSAGYCGHRLGREGDSHLSPVSFDGSRCSFFASGWKYNLMYADKKWYGCGSNENHQMGDVLPSDVSTFTEIPDFSNIVPAWAACGDKLTAIADENGLLFLCGNSYGKIKDPIKLEYKIKFVACGTETVVAIPDGPGIYWFHGSRTPNYYSNDGIIFVDAAAGQSHFLALSEDGKIYSWGRKKQCGQGKKFQSNEPKLVECETTFTRVFGYNASSFAIDQNGNVWSCGINGYGQIGQGNIGKLNKFKMIQRFTEEKIKHIACGDTMAYFLTEEGNVFACGERDNERLCMDTTTSIKTPSLCNYAKGYCVSWISAGCSHIFFIISDVEIIQHPFSKTLQGTSAIWCDVQGKSKTAYKVNISDNALLDTGFRHGDKVILKDSNNQRGKVIGLGIDKSLFIQTKDDLKIYKDLQSNFHNYIKLKRRLGSEFITKSSRSSSDYVLDISRAACNPFGLYHGVEIYHEELGKGVVEGVFCNKLFISWEKDDNLVSTGYNCSPFELHSQFKLTKTIDRTVRQITFNNNPIYIEDAPCELLSKYGIMLNDFVSYLDHYYIVIGQFCFKAILRDIYSTDYILADINSILLIRRETSEKTIRQIKGFNNEVVDVLINYDKKSKYIPADRVLTEKGFATIIGKDINKDGFWILTDDCFRLNFGSVYTEQNDMKIICRIGLTNDVSDFSIKEIKKYLPGDIINYENEYYYITKEDNDNLHIRNKNKELSIPCKNDYEIVYRKGISCKKKALTKRNIVLEFDINIDLFKGTRVFPGDTISTPTGIAKVIGILDKDIWYCLENENGAVTTLPQAFYDPNIIKIIRKADDCIF